MNKSLNDLVKDCKRLGINVNQPLNNIIYFLFADMPSDSKLLKAIWAKNYELANTLLTENEINLQDPGGGVTPLMAAVSQNNTTFINSLLKNGAHVNIKDTYGRTALSAANSSDAVTLLINAGANIDERDNHMRTPLMNIVTLFWNATTDALREQIMDAIIALIEKGANLSLQNDRGQNVFDQMTQMRKHNPRKPSVPYPEMDPLIEYLQTQAQGKLFMLLRRRIKYY